VDSMCSIWPEPSHPQVQGPLSIHITKQQNVMELFCFAFRHSVRRLLRPLAISYRPLTLKLRYDGRFESFLASVVAARGRND